MRSLWRMGAGSCNKKLRSYYTICLIHASSLVGQSKEKCNEADVSDCMNWYVCPFPASNRDDNVTSEDKRVTWLYVGYRENEVHLRL